MMMGASIIPIPLPADDCDHRHSLHAALSSLCAMTTSFDAAMDALAANAARRRGRAMELEARVARLRVALRRLGDIDADVATAEAIDATDGSGCSPSDDGGAGGGGDDGGGGRMGGVVLLHPGKYREAASSLGRALREVEDGLSETVRRMSASARDHVRRSAEFAVRSALAADAARDDGDAVPSDAYLDRPSSGLMGFAGSSLRLAEVMRNYRRVLDALVLDAVGAGGAPSSSLDVLLEGRGPGGDTMGYDDDETVHTTTSRTSSYASVASSGTRMTAGQRRRWRNARLPRGAGTSSTSTSRMMIPAAMLPTHVEYPSRHRNSNAGAGGGAAASGRRQSHVGSRPYLCEVLHDAYGIGPYPPMGLLECDGYSPFGTREGGTEFYPPSNHVTDLTVFNTSRNSYGPTSTTNTTAGVSAAGLTSGKSSALNRLTGDDAVSDEKTVPRNDIPYATIVDGKTQRPDGPGKLLSHLVFKENSNATEDKDAPMLDLPATLSNCI
ncbi:hypothetical protein ACHAXA_010478 [Cyclostephanos tholiformis]|uniref:Uncharacterized protein n=1 Tax=Cyclostephanos tholiformis TaxID=382380 RepID=A0ABD3SFS0_9STRA